MLNDNSNPKYGIPILEHLAVHSAVPRGVDEDEGQVEAVGPAAINVGLGEEAGGGEGLGIDAILTPAIPSDQSVYGNFLIRRLIKKTK